MEQRRNQIVELVNRKGSISFAQLKEAFPSVSEMTLRTDLKALDEARRVVRVHGGVKSVEQVVGTDDLLSRRSARNAEAKQIIAEKAAALLRPNTTLFLDSGSTATAEMRLALSPSTAAATETVFPSVETPAQRTVPCRMRWDKSR